MNRRRVIGGIIAVATIGYIARRLSENETTTEPELELVDLPGDYCATQAAYPSPLDGCTFYSTQKE
ncbi:hypothetical protein GOV07_01295 [Candidatus Woesearchaeota archaeon]|nr:hypothetical protein [Candidatus Woesearchaeota archaeon]